MFAFINTIKVISMEIIFPSYNFKMKDKGDKKFIFDSLRKKWLLFTPEEWVRQNFLQYLLQTMHYPASIIAVEKELMLGDVRKRFDILVYNKQHQPWLMVECKAQDVLLNEKVLQQILSYNIGVPVPYLVITNGSFTVAFERKNDTIEITDALPAMH
jgi:hypothetical protein